MKGRGKKSYLVLGLVVAMVVLVVAMVAVGCGNGTTTTTGAPAQSTASTAVPTTAAGGASFKLGYSAQFLTDSFQALEQQEILRLATEAGIVCLEPTNANGDVSKQLTDIHTLVDEGAQALLVIPSDAEAVVPAIEYAVGKGVPVVTVDTAPTGGGPYMTVRADNVRMGETAAEEIGKALGGQGKVLDIQGALATMNGRDRTQGFDDYMAANYPDIKVISAPTDWQAQQGTDALQTVLTANPDLGAIYMQSDAVFLSGVLSVLEARGKTAKVGEPGHIYLISVDGSSIALEAIRSGQLDAVISQPLDQYAKWAVKYLQDAVAGVAVTPGPTSHDSEIVVAQGITQDLLAAPVVTKANVDDPNLWGNLNIVK